MDTMDLLKLTLQVAVPLNIMKLQQEADSEARREVAWRWAGEAVEALFRDGDKLFVQVPDRTANVFNALARGLAGLAVTGGVGFEGLYWKVE